VFRPASDLGCGVNLARWLSIDFWLAIDCWLAIDWLGICDLLSGSSFLIVGLLGVHGLSVDWLHVDLQEGLMMTVVVHDVGLGRETARVRNS
jgi:hypothetical protein